jgi:hypothetical protein
VKLRDFFFFFFLGAPLGHFFWAEASDYSFLNSHAFFRYLLGFSLVYCILKLYLCGF